MKCNSFVYVVKSVQIVIVGLITGTVFLRTTMKQETVDDSTLYLGSLFFGLITIMFNGLAELSMTIVRLPVFFKHKDLKFYPAWAFSLPRYVLGIPLPAVECLAWTLVTYFTIGCSVQGARFFKQFFLLWVVHQMLSALFRFVAGLCRTQVIANTAGAFSLLIFFVLGGFVIPRTQIPSWWTWGY